MTNVSSIAAAGVRASAARYDAGAVKAVKATTPGTPSSVDPASVMVDMTMSQVTYTASLNALRSANKTMMGYMLNIKV
jgi:flagellar basal body rod protein FlgC